MSRNRHVTALAVVRSEPVEPDATEALVERARSGDRTAFEALVRATYADTYTLAIRLTGDEEDARDVVQETYLRAFRGLERFRGDAQFSTWMYRITANCANTLMAKRLKHRHDELAEAIAGVMKGIKIGHSEAPDTQLGPLAMKRQLERVEMYLEEGKKSGADLVTGGQRPAHLNKGYYMEPTLFANVDNKSRIAQEEIFGPVLCLIPAEDEDDAIRIANESNYGLNGSVLTSDVQAAYDISRRIRTGVMGQNGMRMEFGLPFGGFKQSGMGREGGEEGLWPYLETKTILLDGAPDRL